MNETGPRWSSQSQGSPSWAAEARGFGSGDPLDGGEEARWARFEPPLMAQGPGLGAWIDRVLPGARATAIEFLDQGVVNSNYRVDLAAAEPGAAWAGPSRVRLRLSRSDEGPRREGALGERLSTILPVAVPRLLASERAEAPEPHRRALFTWVEGVPLDEPAAPPAPAGGDGLFARDLARALLALHRVRCPAFGRLDVEGAPVGAELDPGRDALRRAGVRFANPAHGLAPERVARLSAAFERLVAPLVGRRDRPAVLTHGDLSPGNVLVAPDPATGAPRLAGLIDWEMARASDAAGDFASLRLEWGGRLAARARRVEEEYLELARAEGEVVDGAEWERRVAVALVPRLLDARMVAQRRLAAAALAALDARLDALLLPDAGGA